MKNNKLIKHKENIFIKMFKFIKRIFFIKNKTVDKKVIKKVVNKEDNEIFLKNIQLKKDSEEIRLMKLKLQYDNGEIDEEDISEEDIDKLVALYKKETEELNEDTLKRKKHIEKMLKEMKN